MMLPLLALIVPLTFAGTPSTLAYLSPEEVLLQEQMNSYQPPSPTTAPNPRTLRDQRLEEMTARERRILEQQNNLPRADGFGASSSSSGTTVGTQHPSAGEEPVVGEGTVSQEEQDILDLKLLRLLEQLDTEETHNANSLLGQQENPLTPTGPGTIAALVVLLASASWILLRASRGKAWLPHIGHTR